MKENELLLYCGQDNHRFRRSLSFLVILPTIYKMVMEVRVVPKIAINDECPWTPQLSVHSVDVTKAFWSTKSVICLSISLIVVVLIGVLIGALLVSVNGETGKSNSIILARKCKLN